PSLSFTLFPYHSLLFSLSFSFLFCPDHKFQQRRTYFPLSTFFPSLSSPTASSLSFFFISSPLTSPFPLDHKFELHKLTPPPFLPLFPHSILFLFAPLTFTLP